MKKSSDAISSLDNLKTSASDQIKKSIALIETVSATPNQIQFAFDMFEELEKLSCDDDTLSAALLYPLLNADNKKKIKETTSDTVYNLLIGTERMEAIDQLKSSQASSLSNNQSDNLRKMLLAIVDDIRIVLIKLAERLTTIRNLRTAESDQQQTAAKQIMDLYAPLANRLGIGQIKWQLEDWAFRFVDQENYKAISKSLKMRRQDREEYINHVQAELELLIKKNKIERYELSGRAKHIYSIYKKTKRKQVSLDEIYDTSAFRILVPEVTDCYTMLSHVHEKWKPIAKEFDDYISKPKNNGYQSIHTAVIGPENINVEIQIRTFDMHDAAELGVAAHWKYKEGASTESHYENKISWLRQMMNWQKEVTQEDIEQTNLYNKVFEDRIYVFTPNGDILDLPAGSTPLDFAYQVHTEVGHRCRGAKVDGKIVALSQRLKTGDKIDIMTAKTGGPSRDWLNPDSGYIASTSAKNKVKLWFRHKDQEKHIEEGKGLWEKYNAKKKLLKCSAKHYSIVLNINQWMNFT